MRRTHSSLGPLKVSPGIGVPGGNVNDGIMGMGGIIIIQAHGVEQMASVQVQSCEPFALRTTHIKTSIRHCNEQQRQEQNN
jgi:hypothetical protein